MRAEETAFRSNIQQKSTIVEVPKWEKPIEANQNFVLLGSCFAQYMGERFQANGMNAVCNPLGAAYNPESIAIQVRQALEMSDGLPVFLFDGKWRCWWANTLLSDTEEGRFRETIHRTFSEFGKALREADYLFLTLGTNVCYRLKENGMTVTNCHKVPDRCFEEVTLSLETCTDILQGMMELLQKECPKLQVVFTVSPYRYKKYGFHGSQLAKATLLLAVDEICKRFPKKAGYFPAYEILLDELRDYSFYAEDMIHPAPNAVDHIWKRFTENCMSKEQ